MATSVSGCLGAGTCCAGWVGAVGVSGRLAFGVCIFGSAGGVAGCAAAWLSEAGGGGAFGLGSLESMSTRSFALGAAGGGLVKIRATAKGRILGVDIDESLLQPSEKQMLEDLVAAAINDAHRR